MPPAIEGLPGIPASEAPALDVGGTTQSLRKAVLCVAGLTFAADALLFYRGAGWTLGGFSLLLLVCMAWTNSGHLRSRRGWAFLILSLGACGALIEAPSLLAAGAAAACLAGFAVSGHQWVWQGAVDWLLSVLLFAFEASVRVLSDFLSVARPVKTKDGSKSCVMGIAGSLLAIGLAAGFIWLFAFANPLIAAWIKGAYWQVPTAGRVFFWIGVSAGCWSVLRPSVYSRDKSAGVASAIGITARLPFLNQLFPNPVLLASLGVFNIIFAVQNGLDVHYLWLGAELPAAVNYAAYAYDGIFALLASVVLSAAFVLLIFRGGRRDADEPARSILMVVWMLQNAFLTVSAARRLLLYVEEYSLTQLRVTGFILMGLVAVGLVLLVGHILFRKRSGWLIDANLTAALSTAYLCAFIDFGALIADYNVRHCREASGRGALLDLAHMRALGTSAAPALQWYLDSDNVPVQRRASHYAALMLSNELVGRLRADNSDWRLWTWRGHRLVAATRAAIESP